MSILETIRALGHDWSVRRERRRTELLIAGLPADVRKDIGWPDGWERRRTTR